MYKVMVYVSRDLNCKQEFSLKFIDSMKIK